ncbi:AAA family ATPase [Candidatus Entotheonella palauensis]|uniref:AAA-ATPase-like domain-containing protein n=1 Tax=Candidatus Entotheonella gemina TaxID=1429439 RepID=W4M4C3_9BACT|nr:AAA family ATPase [Candidatus Entotheonella palauensis]ETX05045.1 MAG: hypothetical protein ETSY2_25285 [Candidatus Entotheonella gemina]
MDTQPLHLKPPIGFSDFRELRQAEPKRLYVDKSRLISEVLRDDAKVLLFPRPRRFGKTLNLSMLRYFLEKNEQDFSELFSDLEVWRDSLARDHFQQYPTVFVTFKDIKERSFEQTFEGMREVIRQIYHEHRHILNSPLLTDEQKARYQLLLHSGGSEIIVRRALLDLTEYLSIVHNQQVVLLIDEYDTPIQQGFLKGFYDEAVDFFRNFYAAALKDNVYLFRGILSGICELLAKACFPASTIWSFALSWTRSMPPALGSLRKKPCGLQGQRINPGFEKRLNTGTMATSLAVKSYIIPGRFCGISKPAVSNPIGSQPALMSCCMNC